MSYNSRLQEANTDLQSLIDKANALPDAGSGSGGGGGGAAIETCTVTIHESYSNPFPPGGTSFLVYCTTLNDGVLQASKFKVLCEETTSISNVVCGSIVTMDDFSFEGVDNVMVDGDCELVGGDGGFTNTFTVGGDCTLYFYK